MSAFRSMRGLRTLISLPIASAMAELFGMRRLVLSHLAAPTGRLSGLMFGYSQIVNPFYLWRKNGKPGLIMFSSRIGVIQLARNLSPDVDQDPK